MKIVFDKPVKYKGKKIEANKIIEINENEKVDLLNCGAFIVQPALIGVNKKGDRIIIDFVPEVEDNKQTKKEGKKENKGRK